jgi:hypothetical protein
MLAAEVQLGAVCALACKASALNRVVKRCFMQYR